MATLAELRTMVQRDLRDTNEVAFLPAQLDDFINAGIEEVSRVYPQEKIETVTPVANQYEYDLSAENFIHIFRVEWMRNDDFYAVLTESDGDAEINGWEFFAGILHFPYTTLSTVVPATDDFRVWGYATRAQLTTDAQVAELDTTAQWAVRAFARAQGFQALHADRGLFKAWQAQSQNSDVSPTQLTQMVAFYNSEWDRQRNYLRRLRRV